MVIVEDVAPVILHIVGIAFHHTRLELVEHPKLGFEHGVEQDDVLSCHRQPLAGPLRTCAEQFPVDQLQFQAHLAKQVNGFDHQLCEDEVEQSVGSTHFKFFAAFILFKGVAEELIDNPMRLPDSDDEVLSPEEFYLPGPDKTVLRIELGEQQDEKVVVVIDVDLRPLVGLHTVLQVERMEMIGVLQERKILSRRVLQMLPFEPSYFDCFDHGPFPC